MAEEDLTGSDRPHYPIVTKDLVLNLLIEVKIVIDDDNISALLDLAKPPFFSVSNRASTKVPISETFLGSAADLLYIA
jgi:hypothetical protein